MVKSKIAFRIFTAWLYGATICIAPLIRTYAQQQAPSDSWRSAGNGGINVLYCYLRVNGVSCVYSDLVAEQTKEVGTGMHTATTLRFLSKNHGLELEPVSMTMDDLSKCSLPVIVHVDGESPDSGAFLLLFAMSSNAIDFLNGPSASIHEMTRANFRRIWSGFALVPVTGQGRNALKYLMSGFATGLVLLIVVRRVQFRRYDQ